MKYVLPILVLLLGSACSSLIVTETGIPSRLEQLLADQRYSQALELIDKVPKSSPLYLQLRQQRKEIEQRATEYDDAVVKQVTEHQRQLEWQQAEHLFEMALYRLPKNSRTASAYPEFLEQRRHYINDQQLTLNLLLAERMVEVGQYYENIYRADPSWQASRALKHHLRQRAELAKYMAEQGFDALNADNFNDAKKYLRLSERLQPNVDVAVALKKVSAELDARWAKDIEKYKERRQQELARLVVDYDTAFSAGDYLAARGAIEQLIKLDPENQQNRMRRSRLDAAVEREVRAAMVEGEQAYLQGDVLQALEIWRNAIIMAPNHPQLQGHIARAERFVERYESLKK